MSESGIVTRDELLAMGCEEVVSQRGRRAFVIGEEVIAIDCTECNSLKVRSNFGRHNSKFLGVNSSCKECIRERNRKWRQDNPEKATESSRKSARKYYEDNREKELERARKWAEANPEYRRKYYEDNREKELESARKWRQDNPEKATESNRKSARKYRQENPEYWRKYYEDNREKVLEYQRKHYEANPEMYLLKDQRRRARKLALPYDLTAEQQADINATFGNACALTGEPIDLHLDHVIPISVGHGGTTYGNMIPLSATLNTSKNASHLFEWFEANRERFNLSQRKFDELIEYLAQVNEMTTQEYRAYVDWCFDNPRDVGELQDAV